MKPPIPVDEILRSQAESDELLWELVHHIRKPEFHYFHQWKEGDMVLWDNWRAMHCATGTPPGIERVIHRTTIEGNEVMGRVLAVMANGMALEHRGNSRPMPVLAVQYRLQDGHQVIGAGNNSDKQQQVHGFLRV